MKKNILKTTLTMIVVAASCYGSYRAYDMYTNKDIEKTLLMENVEALSQWTEGYISDGYACVHTRCYNSCGLPTGNCYATAWKGGRYNSYHSHSPEKCCSYK